jgi:DNA polymerase-3 subunit alpha
MMAAVERAVQAGAAVHADRRSGQKGLFDAVEDETPARQAASGLANIPEWEDRERLAYEKEVLGFYLTSHPLAEHEALLKTYCSHSTLDVGSLPNRTEVVLGGMISAINIAHTKKTNAKYANFDLEDMSGVVRCILWPEDFAKYGNLVAADSIVVARGAAERRPGSEVTNLIVNELIPLAEVASRFTRGIVVRVSEGEHGQAGIESLHEILRGYPGSCELQLVICLADGTRVLLKSDKVRVDLNPEMRTRIEGLLGPGNVRLLAAPPPSAQPRARPNGRPRELAAH